MSMGSFGNSMRNGLKTDTRTMTASDSPTAPGTATRKMRTIRLWRAATAKRASIPASKAGFWTEFKKAPTFVSRHFSGRSGGRPVHKPDAPLYRLVPGVCRKNGGNAADPSSNCFAVLQPTSTTHTHTHIRILLVRSSDGVTHWGAEKSRQVTPDEWAKMSSASQ